MTVFLDSAGGMQLGALEPIAPAAPAAGYDRKQMRAELIRDEALKLKVYRCTAGKLTIGIGRNLDDVGLSLAERRTLGITIESCTRNGITREQALALCDNDLDRVDADLDRALPWWRRLDPVRQRVLVNMCFNMGLGRRPTARLKGRGLLAFTGTLPAIEQGRYDTAAANMLKSLWADQVGARAERLAFMMKTGRG